MALRGVLRASSTIFSHPPRFQIQRPVTTATPKSEFKKAFVEDTPETNLEDLLPPELKSLRPVPKSVWFSLVAGGAVLGFLIPWKSWIDHIFFPPDDDD
eukprot:TRINITY_DN1349_c0_g1_i1.p1 TRINITY_DN1349_c0_g1~~TRINITY_DN1349_c0_g1_i1.p1  ORF type:complete len:115 (-),score=27.87 TRINITY_DN1349_c0_g1_i1:60-356(-)